MRTTTVDTPGRLGVATLSVLLFWAGPALGGTSCSAEMRAAFGHLLIVKSTEPAGGAMESFEDWLAARPVGGIYLSKRNTRSLTTPAAVGDYVARLQATQVEPVLVAVDQEGGSWQALDADNGFEPLPSASELCARSELVDIEAFAETRLGRPLAEVGVTMGFAPVLDVALDGASEIIVQSGRACSAEPGAVAAYGDAMAKGLSRAGVIPVGKHFPGHGDVSGDTHRGMVRSDKTLDLLRAQDLRPFEAFIDADWPAIMVSHIIVDALDPDAPASLSAPAIGHLRTAMGFEGLVVTDDMSMGAIRDFTREVPGEAALRAILAGVDLVIVGREDYDPSVDRACAALDGPDGPELAMRLGEAAARIAAVKMRYGLEPLGD